ncbi:30S ribosomal subunit maturation GTPase Era [Gammaproteobacteria bacterium]
MDLPVNYRCGFVAVVGRPNVGKSTIVNRLVGQKISITARRPQTTRHRILGVCTRTEFQAIYVDTPGMHREGKYAMSRYLNRTAHAALGGVDVVVMVVAGTKWVEEDDLVLGILNSVRVPVILAINKSDLVHDKSLLLPYLQQLSTKRDFFQLVPLSALRGDNINLLEQVVVPLLPEGHAQFSVDQVTDRSLRFIAAELVREKLIRHLGAELPYAITCEVESFVEKDGLMRVGIIIWVERPGQKGIVIGKNGTLLKQVGQEAREDMERCFERKVFLETWVRIRTGWSDDEQALKNFGYESITL